MDFFSSIVNFIGSGLSNSSIPGSKSILFLEYFLNGMKNVYLVVQNFHFVYLMNNLI